MNISLRTERAIYRIGWWLRVVRHKDAFGRPWPWKYWRRCVGAGWRPLLDKLRVDLFRLGWDGSIHQVKEKYGGLRFYIGGGSDEIFDRIYKAEEESLKTCESCGAPGSQHGLHWTITLCQQCLAERERA